MFRRWPSRNGTLALLAFAAAVVSFSTRAGSTEGRFAIGRIVTPTAVGAKNITVFPDGEGLPTGRGTVQQGEKVFARDCAACHGKSGEGRAGYLALAGGIGSLTTTTPLFT